MNQIRRDTGDFDCTEATLAWSNDIRDTRQLILRFGLGMCQSRNPFAWQAVAAARI